MYAIVDIADKQYKVREDDTLYVPHRKNAQPDDTLTIDRVLLVSSGDGDVTLGTPTVGSATVEAKVLGHVKGDKVLVFKKKRRKRYKVKKGHRQRYTQIQITTLDANGASNGSSKSASSDAPENVSSDAPEAAANDEAAGAS